MLSAEVFDIRPDKRKSARNRLKSQSCCLRTLDLFLFCVVDWAWRTRGRAVSDWNLPIEIELMETYRSASTFSKAPNFLFTMMRAGADGEKASRNGRGKRSELVLITKLFFLALDKRLASLGLARPYYGVGTDNW